MWRSKLLWLGIIITLFCGARGAWADDRCPIIPSPPMAAKLKLSPVYDFCPSLDDIAFSQRQIKKLYNSTWWIKPDKIPSRDLYREQDGHLQIALGGAVAGVSPKTMEAGETPLLSGKKPFYIEFDYALTDNLSKDHFPAVWLLPVEHDLRQRDHYLGDPSGYERWQEIDVDEGGYAPGPMGTSIAWEGIYPHYERTRSHPDLHNAPLDRTVRHRYAAAYDPSELTITYYFDDKEQYVSRSPSVNKIARLQNFYIIMSAQSHGDNIGYAMTIYRVRAYTTP